MKGVNQKVFAGFFQSASARVVKTLLSPAVPKSTHFPAASLNVFTVFNLCHFGEPTVISLLIFSVFPWLLMM